MCTTTEAWNADRRELGRLEIATGKSFVDHRNIPRFARMIATDLYAQCATEPHAQRLIGHEMGKFNEELVKAGVMLAGEGLQPSAKGKRIKISGAKRTVVDGPFSEAKELVAGFWIWQVRSIDEAVEWARRCPEPMPGEDAELEIRPFFGADDFGKGFTPELRAQEDRLRAEVERKQS